MKHNNRAQYIEDFDADFGSIGLTITDLADLNENEQDDLYDLIRDFGPDEDWDE